MTADAGASTGRRPASPTDGATRRKELLLTALGIAATLTVFVVDILTPHDYDVSYLYAVTVLVAGFSRDARVVVRTAMGSWGLTAAAFLLKRHDHVGAVTATEIFSRIIACVVIALVAIVVIWVIQRELQNSALGSALLAAEDAREADKRMLAAASAVATIGTWSIDADSDTFEWSDAAAEIHGWGHGERPEPGELLALMPAENAQRVRDALERLWESGLPFREETLIRRPDGTERWIVIMGEVVSEAQYPVRRVHGTVQDITPWKEAELSASSLSHRFAQMTQALPIMLWTANAAGEIDYVNQAVSRYTGEPPETVYADQWLSIVDHRDVERVAESWMDAVAAGAPYEVEYRMRGADGVYRWHHIAAEPEYDDDGAVVRWWGSSINVDAAHFLKDKADELGADREMILESMSDGVMAVDNDWSVTYLNAASERILETTRHELVGRILSEIFATSEGAPVFEAMQTTMRDGTPTQLVFLSQRLHKWMDISVSRTTAGITIFTRDITEVRQLADQLAQSQRLEAVGQLTGGIAHDFNNLLTVVWGGADALLSDPSVQGEAKDMAQLIASAAERAAELTHRLLAFARKQPLEPRAVDINTRVQALEPLLRRALGEHIDMAVVVADEAAVADVDPGQFENALVNLAINARDAMPAGGNLTVYVSTVTLDTEYVSAHAQVLPGDYVAVTVSDTGSGIAASNLPRLFDPFFTTKGLGKGSGLGLAMVWGFIKQTGGNITVQSEEGHGTTFTMYLPAATVPVAAPEATSASESLDAPAGVILVAEDDELVRRFATERLRAHGYTVFEAASGPAALGALASVPHLDLLFTDVVMPGGMTGRQLADAVVERRPGTPVLYASGYTENVILHDGRLDAGLRLVSKPYSTRQLIDRVREALAESKAAAS